jgi:outer membrane protein OmpA-like peptidoglycan-associated protein/tetratricopeptide (TPR) repeat protein
MRVRYLFLVLFLTASAALNGQYTKEFKRIFFDADYLMETGFYEEAFNRYKNLLTLDPGNHNILFHCGACYLNIPGKEEEAIAYLEEAAKGVTQSYKEKTHKEPGAPLMTYLLLGKAYHLDYQFDKAVEAYTAYLDNGAGEDEEQLEYCRMQIEACNRASQIERTRPAFEFQGVLEYFEDDLPSCSNPVISGDGKTLIFLVDYPSDKKIMMTTLQDSLWSRPRVINSEIGMVGETYPTSLSYDGKDLYLVHKYYSHSDIFVSHFNGSRWSEAEDVGYQINGRTSENHASISRDGQTLYFTSDMRGGEGSFDIYVAHLSEKGEWDDVENLGSVINTPYEEQTPFISSNDSMLFFSSQGHATMGGLDVFFSTLQPDGTWSEPENLGYPVNTTGDDLFYNPGWNEMESYYAVRKADDPSSSTINMVMEIEYEDEEVQEELAIADSTSDTGTAETVEADSLTQALLVEPPNTDEIEMVLNEREAETEAETETEEIPVKRPAEETVPVEAPAFTNELTTMVPFAIDKYTLGFAAQLEVEKIAELMMYSPDSRVLLTGHADETADADYNMRLSYARAEMVAEYLEIRGIEVDRIRVEGKGEADPLAINRFTDGTVTRLGRYLNRQVLVSISGRLPVNSSLSGVYIPRNLVPADNTAEARIRENHFTIQLMAVSVPVEDDSFGNLEVSEHACKDGLYRYTTSYFRTVEEAKRRLLQLKKQGYPDAFIQTREWYEQAAR